MSGRERDDGKLEEAAEPAAFHEKVKALEQGETAVMKGGVAVKRRALEDGRDSYAVAGPRRYGRSQEPDWDYGGRHHRTPEEATRAAMHLSAESDDPDSIGGESRLGRYSDVAHNGTKVRVQGFKEDGKAVIVDHVDGVAPQGPGREVDPKHLTGAPKRPRWLMEGAAEAIPASEVARRSSRALREAEAAQDALMEATYDLLEADGLYDPHQEHPWSSLLESAETAKLAATPAPIGKGKGKVEYPPYFQNVRNAIIKTGKTVAEASQIAWGRLRAWATSDTVGPEVKAAAAGALAALEAQGNKHAPKLKEGGTVTRPADRPFWLGEGR